MNRVASRFKKMILASIGISILDIIVLVFCCLSLLKMYSVKKNLLNAYVLNKNKKRRISEK